MSDKKLEQIKELLHKAIGLMAEIENPVLDCPYCGTTELLCGYPNECCTKAEE